MSMDSIPAPSEVSASLSPDDENILDNPDGERPQKRLKRTEEDFIEGDPSEFLLSSSKYHDCHLTVGKPETDEIERIGVSSTHLIAHSPVFRDMLADSELADPSGSNTHIADVSPATFKLMLRYVYGGKLPKMTPEEAVDLALCADKYNIQRLVGKAAKRLKPTGAEDVFPAFMVAMFIKCPDLELQVTKIIQQDTDKIVQNQNFLELDENCILFIVKQTTLNTSELELWKNLVRWAENQVQKHPEKTLRACLHKALQHIRLLVLTLDEIARYVLPTKVLTSDEFVDLTRAVTHNQTVQSSEICHSREKRAIYEKDGKEKVCICNNKYVLRIVDNSWYESTSVTNSSTLFITTVFNTTIDSFVVKSSNDRCYRCIDFECMVYDNDSDMTKYDKIVKKVNCSQNTAVDIPIQKDNGQSLILKAGKKYLLKIKVSPPLPVFRIDKEYGVGMKVGFAGPGLPHIMEIKYRVVKE